MTKEKAIEILEELSKWKDFKKCFFVNYTKGEICEAIKTVLNIVKNIKNDATRDK